MSKFLLALTILFSSAIFSFNSNLAANQIGTAMQGSGGAVYQGVQYCKENNYPYFKIKSISGKDDNGNTFEFTGISNTKEYTLYQSPEVGGTSFTLFCYNNKPEDVDAYDVDVWFTLYEDIMKKAQEPQEEIHSDHVTTLNTEAELNDFLNEKGQKTYVDIYSTYCPPCKTLAPLFIEWAEKNQGKSRFAKINIDEVKELGERFSVEGVPLLLVFDEDGKLIDRKTGLPEIQYLIKTAE